MNAVAIKREAHVSLRQAERALAARLTAKVPLDAAGRCANPRDNVLATISDAQWAKIEADLGTGRGSELLGRGGLRPKFCSAFSSSAMAVNAFGAFVGRDEPIPLPGGQSVRGEVTFEAQRSAGVRGFKPHLDVAVERNESHTWLFVEGKALEYLRGHGGSLNDAYIERARSILSADAKRVYKAFDKTRFALLDAAQLLKHFLAAKQATLGSDRKVILLYVFFEPRDAGPVFAHHREEAERLAAALPDDAVTLRPISYRQLFDTWRDAGPQWLRQHIDALDVRYDVALTRSVGVSAQPAPTPTQDSVHPIEG